MLGGVIWLLFWVHFSRTHGLTENNMKRMLLGLTWLDFDKLAVIPLSLFAVTLVSLRAWQGQRTRRLGTAGYRIALVSIPTAVIAQALIYWHVPWSYYPPEEYWSNLVVQVGAGLGLLSNTVLSIGLVLFGVDFLRGKPLPSGNTLPFLLGILLFTSPWLWNGAYAWLLGLGWSVLGYVLWSTARKARAPSSPST